VINPETLSAAVDAFSLLDGGEDVLMISDLSFPARKRQIRNETTKHNKDANPMVSRNPKRGRKIVAVDKHPNTEPKVFPVYNMPTSLPTCPLWRA
jgi:hypothetical protein